MKTLISSILLLSTFVSFSQFSNSKVEYSKEQITNILIGEWGHSSKGGKSILYNPRTTFHFLSDGTFRLEECTYYEILGGDYLKARGGANTTTGQWDVSGSRIVFTINSNRINSDPFQIGKNGFGNWIMIFNPTYSKSSSKRNVYRKD